MYKSKLTSNYKIFIEIKWSAIEGKRYAIDSARLHSLSAVILQTSSHDAVYYTLGCPIANIVLDITVKQTLLISIVM